jgi:ankyrin repeat protein
VAVVADQHRAEHEPRQRGAAPALRVPGELPDFRVPPVQLLAQETELQGQLDVERNEPRRDPIERDQGQSNIDNRQTHGALAQQLLLGRNANLDHEIEAAVQERDVESANLTGRTVGRSLQLVDSAFPFSNFFRRLMRHRKCAFRSNSHATLARRSAGARFLPRLNPQPGSLLGMGRRGGRILSTGRDPPTCSEKGFDGATSLGPSGGQRTVGRLDVLKALIAADPTLVNAKGGDRKRPLHDARTVEIAPLLLRQGAEIDPRDDDHDSTPAQHMVGDRPEVCRFLIARGARTDLLMACALGDLALVRRHLDADPASIRMRVSPRWLPMIDTAENGGHIYQWALGFYVSAFQVAPKFGHPEVLALLRERAGPQELLLDALWSGDLPTADRLLAAHPGLIGALDDDASCQVADAARQNGTAVALAMLARGFPVTATSQHGATPLHWAAFHGNPGLVRSALAHGAALEARDRDFDALPFGWAIQGSMHGWPGVATGEHATLRAPPAAGWGGVPRIPAADRPRSNRSRAARASAISVKSAWGMRRCGLG